jgi:hypothetical protein
LRLGAPSKAKGIFPRHTAILGTTGGGKSTTVAGLVARARAAGIAVIVLDVEGEYARLHEPTDNPAMLAGLHQRGLSAEGVPADRMSVYHLVGRGTANPAHPNLKEFSLQFGRLSPYAVMEILDLTDAQQERFLKAYDIAKEILRDLHIFPEQGNAEQDRIALELDEFERGYPRMTLSLIIDVVKACATRAEPKGDKKRRAKADEDEAADAPAFEPASKELRRAGGVEALNKRMHAANPPGNAISWRALQGRLSRLYRLKVFFDETADGVRPMTHKHLIAPGRVSVVDLSESGFSELNNIVIADILRGVQDAQDEACEAAERQICLVPRPPRAPNAATWQS